MATILYGVLDTARALVMAFGLLILFVCCTVVGREFANDTLDDVLGPRG